MLYLDDKLPQHPKLFKAGAKLGPNGGARALALYLYGLAYAREHLTDGFVPMHLVSACGLVQTPQDVAKVLVSRGVRLWHRVPGGYVIHDYLDWNPKASTVREKREKWRAKKARQRRGGNGQYLEESQGDTPEALRRDSRAPVPRSKYVHSHEREVRASSTDSVLTVASRRSFPQQEKRPTFATLCAMAKAEYSPLVDTSEWAERVKRRLVGQGFTYPHPHELTAALEAVECAIRRSA